MPARGAVLGRAQARLRLRRLQGECGRLRVEPSGVQRAPHPNRARQRRIPSYGHDRGSARGAEAHLRSGQRRGAAAQRSAPRCLRYQSRRRVATRAHQPPLTGSAPLARGSEPWKVRAHIVTAIAIGVDRGRFAIAIPAATSGEHQLWVDAGTRRKPVLSSKSLPTARRCCRCRCGRCCCRRGRNRRSGAGRCRCLGPCRLPKRRPTASAHQSSWTTSLQKRAAALEWRSLALGCAL